MTVYILITLVAVLVGLGIGILVMRKKDSATSSVPDPQSLVLLQNQIENLAKTMHDRMGISNKEMQDAVRLQFSESQKTIREITQEITTVKELGRQIVTVDQNLKQIQQILQNPKHRGILGEYLLESLLKNVFPPGMYQMQYGFADGNIVDAVIFVKDKIIPIDSKFSLENYNRIQQALDPEERERLEKAFKQDLKLRIDETSKYVRPEEGTMDFAFMFIPAEGIFYDLLINEVGSVKTNTRDLIEYAFIEKKVHIVSPTTLMSHMKIVLQGLKAMQIEEQAANIQKRVGELGKHLAAYNEYMLSLGKSLGTTVGHFNRAHKELGKIDKDVLRITGSSEGLETLALEKPEEIDV